MAFAWLLAAAHPSVAAETLHFGFENGELGGWRIVEGAFGKVVSGRPKFHNEPDVDYDKEGRFFLSTLESPENASHDGYTGVIESPVFLLERPDIRLRVGGGSGEDTYIALCTLEGKEVAWARGNNAERMARHRWQVPELVGEPVFLRVVDRSTGQWGHLTIDAITAGGRIDPRATEEHWATRDAKQRLRRLREQAASIDLAALTGAVTHLGKAYGDGYPGAGAFLSRAADLEQAAAQVRAGGADADALAARAMDEFAALQREALLAHPVLRRHPVLYVTRKQYRPDHHNTATLFQVGEVNTASFEGGGALKAIDFARGGAVTTLLDVPEGIVRDPEMSFDGRRIVFSMRRDRDDDYHIYECRADGSELRQLTRAPRVSDIDPLYLPDGGIVFSSTREPKYCMCNQHIMANLFRMDADGANILQLGKSTLFEGHSALLPDGRVLYDRWEYVDRNFGDAQGLWTVNPDGTNHAVYYGNNTWSPGGVIDARPVPGTEQVVCVLGSCHDRPWGALALLDRRKGVDGRVPIMRTWPESAVELVDTGEGRTDYGFDIFTRVNPKYEDPYPLDANFFLCARMTGDGEAMGMYLVDTFGNEVLLHFEAPGVFDPMPLSPREAPAPIAPRREYLEEKGYLFVADVYAGTHMRGVERGAVKTLRVVESPEKRFFTDPAWGGQGVHRPAVNWHSFENKRILGEAPVEADGSAFAAVPANTFVYFQLLDAEGRMVQSMRSGTILQPGERLGCVGCHEHRRSAPPAVLSKMPQALNRAPSRLEGWLGAPRLFSYRAEVQPVFDAHCVRCHDYGKKAGKTLNLCGDRTLTFNTSYNELWRKGYTGAVGAGPAQVQPAYGWGSHASKLVKKLREGHGELDPNSEAFRRIVTWVDLNAPYYPVYASAYPRNLAGRSPLAPAELARLTELTGVPFDKLAAHNTNRGPQISFDRPELSPCLAGPAGKRSEARAEALEIIRKGAARLKATPRADDPRFTLAGEDAMRERKYEALQQAQCEVRAALAEDRKQYDPGAS